MSDDVLIMDGVMLMWWSASPFHTLSRCVKKSTGKVGTFYMIIGKEVQKLYSEIKSMVLILSCRFRRILVKRDSSEFFIVGMI